MCPSRYQPRYAFANSVAVRLASPCLQHRLLPATYTCRRLFTSRKSYAHRPARYTFASPTAAGYDEVIGVDGEALICLCKSHQDSRKNVSPMPYFAVIEKEASGSRGKFSSCILATNMGLPAEPVLRNSNNESPASPDRRSCSSKRSCHSKQKRR